MNEMKRRSFEKELNNPNITDKEKARIEYKLYKMENRPERGLMIFFGSVILIMLIITLAVKG